MTPRPCRGGAGVGSVFYRLHTTTPFSFYLTTSLTLILLTPPLSPRPHPYPLSKGRGGLQGRESICYMWGIEYISRFIANISTTVITNRKSPGRCALGLVLDNHSDCQWSVIP